MGHFLISNESPSAGHLKVPPFGLCYVLPSGSSRCHSVLPWGPQPHLRATARDAPASRAPSWLHPGFEGGGADLTVLSYEVHQVTAILDSSP